MGLGPGRGVTTERTALGLVGRDAELGAMDNAIAEAFAGAFRVVLVTGPAGVGKSRLATDATARHASGMAVLSARSYRFGTTTSLGPWVEALDRELRSRPADEVRQLCGASTGELAALVSAVRSAVPTQRPAMAPQRSHLLEGLVEVFDNLSRERPVLVALDDLHLADSTSWEALRYLSRRLSGAPIAVIITARPAELRMDEIATEVLVGVEDDGLLRTVELTPLQRNDVAVLVRESVRERSSEAVPAVPEALVTWTMSRTLGYPLFVVTLLGALLDEGGDLAEPRLANIPESLKDRVGLDLGALHPDARELLELLAVVDHRVDLAFLAATSRWSPARLDAALERLCSTMLVGSNGVDRNRRYEVAHPIIQEAVYECTGEARRRELHAEVAETLLAEGQLGPAAGHLARSAGPGDDDAVESLCRAMREAEERGLFREALAVLAALVEVLPAADPRWRQVVDAMTWQAEWVVGHLAEGDATTVIAAMRRAEPALAPDDDPLALAAVQFHLSSSLSFGTGQLDEAETACRTAIDLLDTAGQAEGSLLARNEMGWIRAAAGDLRSAATLSGEVLTAALAGKHPRAAVQASGTYAYINGLLGEFDEAEKAFEQSIELAEEEDISYRAAWGRTQLGFSLGLAGRLAEATAYVESALGEDPAAVDALAHEVQAHGAWLGGDLQRGIEQVEQSKARRPVGGSRRRAWALALAARLHVEMGQPERARRSLDQAERAYAGRPFMVWSFWCDWADGLLAAHEGDRHTAAEALARAAGRLEEIGARAHEALVLVDQVELAAETGDTAATEAAGARLHTIGAELGGGLHPALARLGEAWSFLARGDGQRAAGAASAAGGAFEAGGYAFHHGIALDVEGRALVGRDEAAAVAALEAGAEVFQRCGAVWRRDGVLGRLRSFGSRGRRAAAAVQGPESLTSRERDVARLASRGFTAPEIGEQLLIGTRTVESHLANTYAKLGLSSKRELVRRASEFAL